jgi:hypothetical protein
MLFKLLNISNVRTTLCKLLDFLIVGIDNAKLLLFLFFFSSNFNLSMILSIFKLSTEGIGDGSYSGLSGCCTAICCDVGETCSTISPAPEDAATPDEGERIPEDAATPDEGERIPEDATSVNVILVLPELDEIFVNVIEFVESFPFPFPEFALFLKIFIIQHLNMVFKNKQILNIMILLLWGVECLGYIAHII